MASNLEQQLKEANETIAKMKFAIDFIKPSINGGYEIEICDYCSLPFPSGFCEWGYCQECKGDVGNIWMCFSCKKEVVRKPKCTNCNKPVELNHRSCGRCTLNHPGDKELTECPVCRFPWK
jgi:hypothetical protein